ncbi:MAG: hypothetical protein NDI61_06990 [Bdellovibrionaceae bacterium]|nr:hypothetical protein [Pseudobdellovibrionaceae bacterium]
MSKKFSRDQFDDRLRSIAELRDRLAATDAENGGANCNFYCAGNGISSLSLMRPLGCWLNKILVGSLMLHSGPLVLTHPDFKLLISPGMSLHQVRSAIVGATQKPISKWLRQQPDKSVSHWKLFEEANRMFRDPFVALGVIGDLFESEREWCDRSSNSKRKCELAHKMKPILTPTDSDPVGRNYHFWAHLNMVWRSEGSKEKLASYVLEVLKDDDFGDHAANLLGIDSSIQSFEQTKMKLKSTGRNLVSTQCEL